MPNDPKWRTIARESQTSISDVIAVALHLLTEASANATERGRTQPNNTEHIASALDMETGFVVRIKEAMQGRFLEGERIKNWAKRQPKREDDSAERAKQWREHKKAERNRTQPNATERPDTDAEYIGDVSPITPHPLPPSDTFTLPVWVNPEVWRAFVEHRQRLRKPMTDHAKKLIIVRLADLHGRGESADAVLNQSIERGWQSVFSTKEKNHDRRSKPSLTETIASQIAAIGE